MTDRVTAGAPAPDFKMTITGGETRTLSDYAGQSLVLYFYPKDNTPGCTTQAKDFSALKKEFDAAGAQILGVSRDSLKKHDNFRAKQDLTIDLGVDEDGSVTEAYGVWVEKQMYGKTYMGIERSTFLIRPDGKIQEIWRKVKVKEHARTVLDKLT